MPLITQQIIFKYYNYCYKIYLNTHGIPKAVTDMMPPLTDINSEMLRVIISETFHRIPLVLFARFNSEFKESFLDTGTLSTDVISKIISLSNS
jgi:hypothetical protein